MNPGQEDSFSDRISECTHIVFDLDGVFYPYPRCFPAVCNLASARAAHKLGVPLSTKKAWHLADETYRDYGTPFGYMTEYGVPYDRGHHAYHELLPPTLVPVSSALIAPADLQGCPLEVSILSHSNRGWINSILARFGVAEFFPEERIFGLEDVEYTMKSVSERPYEIVADRLGVSPGQCVMVEDSRRNLYRAHTLGYKTVWLSGKNQVKPEGYSYVDVTLPRLPDFMERVAALPDARAARAGAQARCGVSAPSKTAQRYG